MVSVSSFENSASSLTPCFDKRFERNFAFHRDQSSEALARDFKDGIGNFLDGFALFESRSEKRVAAKVRERPAKLRLKDDHQGDRKKHRETAQENSSR